MAMRGKTPTSMNPTKNPDDWMTDLLRKRQQGRRTPGLKQDASVSG